MAQTEFEDGRDDRPVPGDAAPKISGQRARQGQNIKGMLAVLVVGILLLAGAYAIMLALEAKPSSIVNESRVEAARETQGLAPGERRDRAPPETPPSPQ